MKFCVTYNSLFKCMLPFEATTMCEIAASLNNPEINVNEIV
jgi:hypothetical protein